MKKITTSLIILIFCTHTVISQNFPTAVELAQKMKIGWNIGNTMEAMYTYNGTIVAKETAWGQPEITQTLIDGVKAAGFNTIRIPIAWDVHSSNGTIDPTWIARVKQVVDYCYNQNLYVIINIHWDNGWLEKNCTSAMKNSVNIKQANYWNQIATYFKNYDEHLLFASANEPDVKDYDEMDVLLSYHQTFVNTVRATGGNNAQRILIIQAPGTDIGKTDTLMSNMPTDSQTGRLMSEIHFYPYQFSLMEADEWWGNQYYYWGTCNHSTSDAAHNPKQMEEAWVDEQFQKMKTKFVDKGIPVIMGEFGARLRKNLTGDAYNLHVRSREYFFKYVVKSALNHGIIPIYWCAGLGDLFDRNTGAALEPGTVNALMAGAYSTSKTINCSTNDCKGAAYGHAYTNACGTCTLGFDASCGAISNKDCNGVEGGTAQVDSCNRCTGGNTGIYPCAQLSNGYYKITAYANNLCISSTNDLSQQTCINNEISQIWKIEKSGDNYKIFSPSQNAFLSYNNATDGSDIGFSGINNEFIIEQNSDGNYMIISAQNNDYAIDVPACASTIDVELKFWSRLNNSCQTFVIEPTITNFDCNGQWEGSAYIDNCNQCVGGNTGKEPCSVIEMENICDYEGTIDQNHTGYTGTGFLNMTNSSTASCAIWINATESKTETIEIIYSNGSTTLRPIQILLNGNEAIASCEFQPTTNWDTWTGVNITLNLKKGANKIIFNALTNDGPPNFDKLIVSGNITELECGSQSISLVTGWNLVSLYIEPENNQTDSVFPNASIVKTDSLFFNPSQTKFLNSLQTIKARTGYLVYNSKAEELEIKGTLYNLNSSLSINGGWNIIGIPIYESKTISEVFSNELSNIKIIKTINQSWEQTWIKQFNTIEPGKAYFILK